MRREHYTKDVLYTLREGRQFNFTVPAEAHYLPHTGPARFSRPAPSSGMRKQPEKNTSARRGTAVHLANNQEMGFQGAIEMNALIIFQVTLEVVEFREEFPKVEYRGSDDKLHEHTFDHWLRLRDGTRLVSSAKPAFLANRGGLADTLREIKPFVCPAFADEIHILTEYNVTDAAANSASRILRSRRSRNQAHVEEVRSIAKGIRGAFYLGALAALGKIEADYQEAIWVLIDEGFLRPQSVMDSPLGRDWIVRAGQIDDHTLLCVVRGSE
ncbi:hypothetical protein IFT66_08760 [Rhizobium sp. CFBP 13726]|uniref:hypothetical protein n=1 Tax=Rhizobium sp. CFBP 13726 TaxID=2775296 RepID=UPI001786EBCD|nr:hypothetical protein [Rhizobium sp. CFBP 13726]MBD8651163.1 hypothetical protein [Rhizobium sp. CFBP 13726]